MLCIKYPYYYGNTPRTICPKVPKMALYRYYTPALILPKKGLNVTPTVTPTVPPTPKSSFLSVEVAGYLFGVFSTPFKVTYAVAIRHKKTPKKGVFIRVWGFFGGVTCTAGI